MAEELTIKIGADVTSAVAGLGQVHSKVSDLGSAATTSGGGLASLVNPLTVAAAGVGLLGAGLVDSIGKAGAFDQKMAEIRATMQPTGAEMDKLRGLALQLGAATDVGSVSASDAAEAIGVLGKAGIGADAQLAGVTHSVLQLAAAAGPEFGVAKSAELASDALNSFGLKAGDAKGVVDTLVGAANASSIGLEDLKYGLAASGAVAHTVGLSFKDTATALAVMGANGLKGSDAGTSLKTMLMNLQPHTKAATAEMMALGLVTKDGSNQFFDAQGHMKSMSDVAQILQTSLKGMTDQQRLAALQTMFGSDAIRGASILADQGATGIDKMSAAMAQQGDAAKVAGDMNNNFKGKMEALGGTVETIQIAIGSALTPVLGGLADMLNNSLGNALTNIPALLANIGAALQQAGTFFQPLISGIQAFIAANPQPVLYGVAGALAVALVPALVAAAAAAWAFIAPILAVVAPVLAVGVAIGALKLAWDNNFLGMRDTLIPIWNEITETLTSFWNDIQPDLTAAWTNIQKMAGDAMTFIQTALTTLKKGWDSDWGGIKTILTEVWNVISTTVKTVWDIVSGLISAGLKVLQGDWSGAWTVVKTTLNTVWEDMKTLLGSAITAIGTAITNFVPTLISKLAEWGGAFLGWVAKDVLPTIAAKVGEIAPKIWGKITEIAGQIVTKAADIGAGLINGIVDGLKGLGTAMYDKITSMISGAVDDVKKFFGIQSPSTYTAQYIGIPLGEGIVRGLEHGMISLTPTIVGRVAEAVDAAQQAVGLSMRDVLKFPRMQGDMNVPGAGRDMLGGVTSGPAGGSSTGNYAASWVGTPGGPNRGDTHIHVHIDSEELSHVLRTNGALRNDI